MRVQRRDRPRLDEIGLPVGDGPLDVLRPAVVVLDARADSGEGQDLIVRQHPTATLDRREVDVSVTIRGIGEDRVGLCPDPNVDEARALLGDDVGIRFDLTADDNFTEPERSLDDDAALVVGGRIDGEHHTTALRRNHALDDDRDRRLVGDAA